MKIAVIAANGRTGQAFVEQALIAGHTVTAGIHGKNYFKEHDNLKILECDATNEEQLKNIIINQDAIASFIGHVKGSKPNVQTESMQKIINVMQAHGVKRLISLTGTGVRFFGDKISLIDRILNLFINTIDPARILDGKNHAEVIKNSNLDWTIIRVLKLQNTKAKQFELSENGPTKWYVSRTDVAKAVLQVLEHNTFVNKAPIIGKATK